MPSAAPVTTPEPEELKHSAKALDSTGFEKILIKVQVDGGANATDFAGRTVQNRKFCVGEHSIFKSWFDSIVLRFMDTKRPSSIKNLKPLVQFQFPNISK